MGTNKLIHIGPLRNESEEVENKISMDKVYVSINDSTRELEGKDNKFKRQVALCSEIVEVKLLNIKGFECKEFSSGLKELYPGVKEVGRLKAKLSTLNEIISELDDLNEKKIKIIILEQTEYSIDMLNDWYKSGLLDSLSDFWIRVSTYTLHPGMPSINTLLDWFQERGFEVQETEGDIDPDFSLYHFTFDNDFLLIKDLESQVQKLTKDNEALNKKIIHYKSEIERCENAISLDRASLSEKEEQILNLSKINKDFVEKNNNLEEIGKNQITKYDKLKEKLQELEQKHNKLTQENKEFSDKNDKLRAEMNRAEISLDIIKDLMMKNDSFV